MDSYNPRYLNKLTLFLLLISCSTLINRVDAARFLWPSRGSGNALGEGNASRRTLLQAQGGAYALRVRRLIESRIANKQADVNAANSLPNPPLLVAAQYGLADLVEDLLTRGADVEIRGSKNTTALIISAAGNHTAIVQTLLDNDADVDAKSGKGMSALWLAAARGNLEIVKMLLGKNAAVDTLSNSNATPLIMAVDSGHYSVAEVLIDYDANVNAESSSGASPLLLSVQFTEKNKHSHVELCELLLKNNADPNTIKPEVEQSVLWIAAYGGDHEVVALLLEYGANPDTPDGNGTPPSVVAVKQKCYECLKLIAPKADLSISENTRGWTPLHAAAAYGDITAVKILLNSTAVVASATLRSTKDNFEHHPIDVIGAFSQDLSDKDRKDLEEILAMDQIRTRGIITGDELETSPLILGNPTPGPKKSSGLPTVEIVMIAFACFVFLVLLVVAGAFYAHRRRKRNFSTGENINAMIDTPDSGSM